MERLTDEELSILLTKSIRGRFISDMDVRRLVLDVQYYKQLSEKRWGALESIRYNSEKANFISLNGATNFKEFIGEIARQALEGDTP